jgi:hypothetical protein
MLSFLAESFFFSPAVSSIRAVNFGSGCRNRRIKSRRKVGVVAALLAGPWLGANADHFQNATWAGMVTSQDFNNVDNRMPMEVPTVTATFGASAQAILLIFSPARTADCTATIGYGNRGGTIEFINNSTASSTNSAGLHAIGTK